MILQKIIGSVAALEMAPDTTARSSISLALGHYSRAKGGNDRAAADLLTLQQDQADWRANAAAELLLFCLVQGTEHGLPDEFIDVARSALPAVLLTESPERKAYIRRAVLRLLPKASLHDHLDGGVRPRTILELALAQRVDLRAKIPELPERYTLADIERFAVRGEGAGEGDFLSFLIQRFALPLAVMQTEAGLERTAFELVEQAYLDGVIHLEARFAPVIHKERHLTYDAIVDAVISGLLRGEERFGVTTSLILCFYRNLERDFPGHFRATALAAKYAQVYHRDRIGIGIDLAGKEDGYPPERAEDAYRLTFDTGVFRTVHAGEMPGTVANIENAVRLLRPHRIGHGNRLVEVLDRAEERQRLRELLDKVTLEMCSTSNVQLLCSDGTIADHPLLRLHRAGFKVTMNPDNRTISGTSVTEEFFRAVSLIGVPLAGERGLSSELREMTQQAFSAAFIRGSRRDSLLKRMIHDLANIDEIIDILRPYI